MNMFNYVLFICLSAFGSAFATIPLAKKIAFRLGIVSMPAGDRWHERSTPLLGGIPIFVGLTVGTMTLFSGYLPHLSENWSLWIGAGLFLLLGLFDDVVTLRA